MDGMTRSARRRGSPASPLIDLAVTDARGGGPFAAWCRSALDSLEDGVGLLDVSDHEPPRLLHSNPAFDRIAGLPPQRTDAIPIYEIAESRFAAAIAGTCGRCSAGETAPVDRYESREPERRIYEISGIPYRLGQDRHRLVTVIARDVTELEALRSTVHARD
jgi:PAS domain-containing protein